MASDSAIPTLLPISELDYFDSRSIVLPRPIGALEAWNLIATEPQPLLGLAMRIRDAISSRFGTQKIGGFAKQRPSTVTEGDRIDFFLVERATPDLLVLTNRDRHLDVMTCVSTAGPELTLTASVVTHNVFGRVYMLPVGIAHRLIAAHALKHVRRSLLDGGS